MELITGNQKKRIKWIWYITIYNDLKLEKKHLMLFLNQNNGVNVVIEYKGNCVCSLSSVCTLLSNGLFIITHNVLFKPTTSSICGCNFYYFSFWKKGQIESNTRIFLKIKIIMNFFWRTSYTVFGVFATIVFLWVN